jgi:alkanesulfonate monooxygenase SsuD/methylene tetrahydromethanopterin reductase-like flavin-dependent oxidoreductase (luciferase family)
MIGAGWLKEEFEVLGVEFHTRGRRLDECVEAMRRIWTSELASYEGEFITFRDIASEPKPVQPGGVPLWFAGEVPQTYARVAKWGVGWSPHLLSPPKIAEGASGSARTRTTGARRSASSTTSPACAWPRSTG